MVSSINSTGSVPPIAQGLQSKQTEATAAEQKAIAVIQKKTAVTAAEKTSSALPQDLLSDEVKKTLQSASGSATATTSNDGPSAGDPDPGAGSEKSSSSTTATYDSRDTNKDGKVSTNELLTASANKKKESENL
jgi:hypothetical protein